MTVNQAGQGIPHKTIHCMKNVKSMMLALAATLVLGSSAPTQAQEAQLTLPDVVNGAYYPSYVYGVNPLNDGESYTQLADGGRRIVRHSFKTGAEVGTIFDVENVKGKVKLQSIDGYVMSPDEKRILVRTNTKMIYRRSYTATYYIYEVDNRTLTPLSDGGAQQAPRFSPDGTLIAFARDNNLFIVKLLYGNAETQVTKDGKRNEVLNGIPDWVNEEEFSTNCSFDFTADSRVLAWVRYDESDVPEYTIPMYKGASPTYADNDEYPGAFRYKYPVAGAQNSRVTVLTYDVKDRVTRTLKLPLDADGYVPRIFATDDPTKLAVVTLNRHQNRMDIYMANPLSTECKLAVREENERYVPETAYGSLKFYGDHFAYISDRDGYKHIYWYTLGGQLERQVTKGDYDVADFYGYDAKSGAFYYAAHKESPLRTAVYVTDRKGRQQKLGSEVGTHSALFSKSMKYYLNIYSSAQQPPVTTLRQADGGKVLATLEDNASLKSRVDAVRGQTEFFTFTTADGVALNGWMVKPRDFDPARKYPVIMYQYSGPGSQEVKDAWNYGFFGGGLFESYMAQQGFIYVCVDGRGTGCRGAEFEKCTYLRLGEKESHDQVEAATYLGTLPYVDKAHIAIWGWSFGGFNTLMSMSEGRPVFCAGVAVAAPTNWKYYDTVYTERYMRTPKENADGYAVNPIQRAGQLHGDLLLIHGTADDNVHFRNFTEVSEAYVQQGTLFRQQVYTNRNHFINGGGTRLQLFRTLEAYFNEKLK